MINTPRHPTVTSRPILEHCCLKNGRNHLNTQGPNTDLFQKRFLEKSTSYGTSGRSAKWKMIVHGSSFYDVLMSHQLFHENTLFHVGAVWGVLGRDLVPCECLKVPRPPLLAEREPWPCQKSLAEMTNSKKLFEEVIGFSHFSNKCTFKIVEGHFSPRFLAEGRRDTQRVLVLILPTTLYIY